MNFSEMYKALRMQAIITEYDRDEQNEEDTHKLVNADGKPLGDNAAGLARDAVVVREKIELPFYTTYGERSFIAQMIAMPEAKVFLSSMELNELREKYGDKPEYPIEIPDASVWGGEWQDEQYIDRLKLIFEMMDNKIYNKSIEKETSIVNRFIETCFYYRNSTLTNNVVEGIGFPIGINVDIKTHIWYLDFYNIDSENIYNSIRVHARISRIEYIKELKQDDYGKECHRLEKQMDNYIKVRCSEGKALINDEEELIETIVYGDAGNIVSENGRRPYKVCVYVRNTVGAPDRAAAAFTRYKRKISIEETDIFTGNMEKVFCFKIYYFEWERQEVIRAVLALGKYAYVKPLHDQENDSFIAQLMEIIRRCKETYIGNKAITNE